MSFHNAEHRYKSGRRLMLISAALYAFSRALTYLPNPEQESPQAIQTFSVLVPEWVFASLWVVVIVLCVRDLLHGAGRAGISALVGVMAFWGAIYGLSYVATVVADGWGSREWSNATAFLFLAGIILGLLLKVGALKPARSEL